MAFSKKTSTGATKRTKGPSKGSSAVKKVKKETPQEAYILDKVATKVQKRIEKKGLSPSMHKPKNILVMAAMNNMKLAQGYPSEPVTFLPVTWAIPTQRRIDDPADERFTESLSVHIKGVRVRFSVVYKDAFRIRMALYKPADVNAFHPFTAQSFAGVTHPVPDVAFSLDWVAEYHANVVVNGPFSHVNINRAEGALSGGIRAPPPAPVWLVDSGDGTLFTADLAKGDRKPIATYELMRSAPPGGGHGVYNVDWYVELEKVIHRIRELDKVTWGESFQIMLYYDCPSVETPATPVYVAAIRRITVKVYFR
jgi:hypothetical protein